MSDVDRAGAMADEMIANEVAIQDRMWGAANEAADVSKGQLFDAAFAQMWLVMARNNGEELVTALASAKMLYPDDWDGFRDYGSIGANLAVAAAYIRNEIKRRAMLGEDMTRSKRGEPYSVATPYVSSDVAVEELKGVSIGNDG